MDAFRSERSGRKQSYVIGTDILAFNRYGSAAGREMEKVTAQQVFTPDLGGRANTREVTDAVLRALEGDNG